MKIDFKNNHVDFDVNPNNDASTQYAIKTLLHNLLKMNADNILVSAEMADNIIESNETLLEDLGLEEETLETIISFTNVINKSAQKNLAVVKNAIESIYAMQRMHSK